MPGCEERALVSIEPGSRAASGTMNAAMTVIAYRGDGSVAATWQGSARWLGPIPASGVFTGAVNGGRVTWEGASARDVRVETERDGNGGLPLRRGSGARSSWVDEPTAALSPRGARVPKPGGAEGGSPAGTGKPGDRGLSMGTPVFGGAIAVPSSIAPALDVAVISWEAGLSPAALARKWIRRALRVGTRRLRREIGEEAAENAARAPATTENRLARSVDFSRLSTAEQRQILDAMDDAQSTPTR